MKPCRECSHEVGESARTCPQCGAMFPAKDKWDGYGWEYKSRAKILGLPLLNISFKYSSTYAPIPACGIISIGQFGAGIINISQFGVGVFSLSQFTIALFALTQIGAAYSLIAQVGIYISHGYGQKVFQIGTLLGF